MKFEDQFSERKKKKFDNANSPQVISRDSQPSFVFIIEYQGELYVGFDFDTSGVADRLTAGDCVFSETDLFVPKDYFLITKPTDPINNLVASKFKLSNTKDLSFKFIYNIQQNEGDSPLEKSHPCSLGDNLPLSPKRQGGKMCADEVTVAGKDLSPVCLIFYVEIGDDKEKNRFFRQLNGQRTDPYATLSDNYFLIPVKTPDFSFAYYAIPDNDDGKKELQAWISNRDINFIGIDEAMEPFDQWGCYITMQARIVTNELLGIKPNP